MYKIINGLTPQCLCNIVVEGNQNRPYNFCRTNALKEPHCRLETYRKSFFPRTIKLWNNLPNVTQSASSLDKFKLNFKPELTDILLLYYYGERWPSVHHARMRIGCSKLNADLCNNLHVVDHPGCPCGAPLESAHHFFFECPRYIVERNSLFNYVERIIDVSLANLLYGNKNISLDENKRVFDAVHQFIIATNRF